MRKGGPREIKLERFEEALHDPTARLTYSALSGVYILLEVYFVTGRFAGVRKQSVEDVERLFNQSLVAWMDKKGYDFEARHLSVICNWRSACDERGLPSVLRSQFNDNFIEYILDELMPWHADEGLDFSLLEVNQ